MRWDPVQYDLAFTSVSRIVLAKQPLNAKTKLCLFPFLSNMTFARDLFCFSVSDKFIDVSTHKNQSTE